MVTESILISKAIDSMAEAAKAVVQESSDWMRQTQSLPVEEAEAEYARSAVEGDSILKKTPALLYACSGERCLRAGQGCHSKP